MTFEVDLKVTAGRTRTVSIERTTAGRYIVRIDGEPHELDAVRVGTYGLSMLLDDEAGINREVQVTPAGGPGELLVTIQGRAVAASVNGRRTGRVSGESGAGQGPQSITAPMPGRVVRVLVSPGDEVAHRQGIVVVEAMKMENELRAPRAGRVKEVAVTPGTSVEAGRVLAVIE